MAKGIKRGAVVESVGRTGFLSSAGKALDALRLLRSVFSLSVTELSKARNIPMSTAYRILTTLTRQGFAVRNPKDRRYYLNHTNGKTKT